MSRAIGDEQAGPGAGTAPGEAASAAGRTTCPECGASIAAVARTRASREVETAGRSEPTFLYGLVGCWILFAVGYPALAQAGTLGPVAVLGVLAIVVSLPVLWFDARAGMRAGELPGGHPTLVAVPAVAIWPVTVPLYVGYRVYSREP